MSTKDIIKKQPVNSIIHLRWLQMFGLMPACYIATSFVNFLVGVTLGLIMTLNVSTWGVLTPLHAELNPYGWLTMLMYGMTYAVLKWFAGLESSWPKLGWSQLIMAETSVILIVIAHLAISLVVLRIGLILQAIAPILFLVNILFAVSAKRQRERTVGKHQSVAVVKDMQQFSNHNFYVTTAMERMYLTLGVIDRKDQTDSVAQRGTDIALLILIICTIWMSVSAWFTSSFSAYSIPLGATALAMYGWLTGTVLAVSLHLYSRYGGSMYLHRWTMQVGQSLWLIGLLIATIGYTGIPAFIVPGSRLLGCGFAWVGLVYLLSMLRIFTGMAHPVHIAWKLSTLSLFILGVSLLSGLPIMDLAIFHLMFLGWMTMLVYGVGYTFFPLLLKRYPRSLWLSRAQVWLALIGVILMVFGFYCMERGLLVAHSSAVLAVGGSCSAVSILYFILQWPFGKKMQSL